jgi:outer membrane lipoprotein-sorting protein
MKATVYTFLLLVLGFGAGLAEAGSQPDAAQIIAGADRARGNVNGVIWTAEIDSLEEGHSSQRTMQIKNRGINTLAESIAPAKVKGHKILMLDRNMWFVKPGLRKPVPISPRQKLMGGAANGDIASTNYAEDYTAELAGEETIDGEACWLFDLGAADSKVTYDRIRYWISKERQLGLKAEFFTVSGKMLKTARFKYENRIQLEGKDSPFMSEMAIEDAVQKANLTVMRYSDISVEAIPDAVFNLNLLVR